MFVECAATCAFSSIMYELPLPFFFLAGVPSPLKMNKWPSYGPITLRYRPQRKKHHTTWFRSDAIIPTEVTEPSSRIVSIDEESNDEI